MKTTEATAIVMGAEARAAGTSLSRNPFSLSAYHAVQDKLGRRMSPKVDEWMHWAAMWNKGWLEAK
jgi:hypothetical protein